MSDSNAQGSLTRRRFLGWAQSVLAAAGAVPLLGKEALAAPAAAAHAGAVDYYKKLGVNTLINAKGTFTDLTAACMPAPVREAVYLAAFHPVHLVDLQHKAGDYIASQLKCESALVSDGASSALTLATAACVQAANGCQPTDIPQLIGTAQFPKNEVIVQKAHRYGYDHAMLLCGVKIVEVVSIDDYKKAFSPNTVMTNFFNAARGGEIQHEQWLEVAHQNNIPCHIDAAADMPPIENLWKYTQMGFDLVCFSGGKGIRGPQNAGLLLGKKKYIDFAHQSNPPADGVGRGMKVAKEQLVGMVAAVDWILTQTDEGMEKEFKRREDVVWGMLKDVPTIQATTNIPEVANHVPVLVMTYDPAAVGISAPDVQAKLRELPVAIELAGARSGSAPRRFAGQGGGGDQAPRLEPPGPPRDTISVSTWMLQPGEELIVGRELRKLLIPAKGPAHAKAKA
jgi:L-seryl-tRNA(Ser) seleniumtransferase